MNESFDHTVQTSYPTLNKKFKTSVCQNFMKGMGCQRGSRCHFAHGYHELREENEELPQQYVSEVKTQQQNYYTVPYCNYKTVMCRLMEDTGSCKFGQNCRFAHGESELRNPHDPLAQNLVQENQTASMAVMNAFITQPPPQTTAAIWTKLKDKQDTPPKCSTNATSNTSSKPNSPNVQPDGDILQSLYKGVAPRIFGQAQDQEQDLKEVTLVVTDVHQIRTKQSLQLAEQFFKLNQPSHGLIIVENLLTQGHISFRFPKIWMEEMI